MLREQRAQRLLQLVFLPFGESVATPRESARVASRRNALESGELTARFQELILVHSRSLHRALSRCRAGAAHFIFATGCVRVNQVDAIHRHDLASYASVRRERVKSAHSTGLVLQSRDCVD